MGSLFDGAALLRGPRPRGYRIGLHALAKVNLGLRVGPLRSDGYHEIFTIFQTVGFGDTLWARPTASGIRLRVLRRAPSLGRGLGIPRGTGNLVVHAAQLAQRHLGESRGAELLLIKRVPAGSGLGGGSSDAVATVRLVARLWGRRLSRKRWRELSVRLGSDCPFFVDGGRAAASGRGERLRSLPVGRAERLILVLPRCGVATREAYRLLDVSKRLTPPRAASSLGPPLAVGLRSGRARPLMPNELEGVIRRRYPEVGEAISLLSQQGVTVAQMSGSGSAVFGLLPPGADPRRLQRTLRRSPFAGVLARFHRAGSVWCR